MKNEVPKGGTFLSQKKFFVNLGSIVLTLEENFSSESEPLICQGSENIKQLAISWTRQMRFFLLAIPLSSCLLQSYLCIRIKGFLTMWSKRLKFS